MKDKIYLNPKAYTLTAMIVGYALIGNYSACQQNAIGNWFMTLGQILESNAAIQQAIEEHINGDTFNINSKQYKNGGSPYMNNPPLENFKNKNNKELDDIKRTIDDLINKINNIN